MIVVLGGSGGIGKELSKHFAADATTRTILNVEREDSIEGFCRGYEGGIEPMHVINATGISISSMVHKMRLDDIQKIISVNLVGNLLLLKHLRGIFKSRPGSSFTMLGSVTADVCPIGTAAYTSTKAALRGLVRVASLEFAPFARVNLVEIGYSTMGMISQVPYDSKWKLVNEIIPMKRLALPEDICQVVETSIECKYLTGSILKVNGGLA